MDAAEELVPSVHRAGNGFEVRLESGSSRAHLERDGARAITVLAPGALVS